MEQKSDQINYTFRLLYAIGIVLVVAGHCQGGGIPLLEQWFAPYGYHLGLFVFASGYFYKDENEAHIGRYTLKKVRRLLVPLYLWNIFYAILVWVLSFAGFTIGTPVTWYKLLIQPITDGHQFMYNMGGWFVVPLFMVEMAAVLARKMLYGIWRKSGAKPQPGTAYECVCFLLSLAAGIIGCTLAIYGYNTGWWLVLVRQLYFLPFYGLGIFYRRVLESYDRLPSAAYLAICVGIAFVIIAIYGQPLSYTPSFCNDFYQGPVMPYVVGFTGIAFWLRIAKILTPAIGRSRVVNLLAGNTYSIMINQFLGFMLVKGVFAVLARVTPWFHDFSMRDFKRHILLYFYTPGGKQWLLLYLLAGLFVPVGMQWFLNRVKTSCGMMKQKLGLS